MNSVDGVWGQILTAVIHMTLLVIQFKCPHEMLYPHTIMIWLDLALRSPSITKNDDFSCLT